MSLPPCHVQAVSCIAATPYHLLTGSDDSNVHVWSLAQLLELHSSVDEQEPLVSFSNHRGAITALAVSAAPAAAGGGGGGSNPESSFCVSASKDKTCVIWNYRSGQVLRTLLFPSFPMCLALDPAARGVFASTQDGAIYSVDFFSTKPPLLGRGSEDASTVVQIATPLCTAPVESGPATCVALTHDGTTLLSGHPKGQVHVWAITDKSASSGAKELANVNAAVTNIVFVPPFAAVAAGAAAAATRAWTVVKPAQAQQRAYNFSAQFEADLAPETPFAKMVTAPGFARETLDAAISAFWQPSTADDDLDDTSDVTLQQIQQQWNVLDQLIASS